MKHLLIFGFLMAAFFVFNSARGQAAPEQLGGGSEKTRVGGDWPQWGDAGDGRYRNPVLPADYSDLDCIRVGADYYASKYFEVSKASLSVKVWIFGRGHLAQM